MCSDIPINVVCPNLSTKVTIVHENYKAMGSRKKLNPQKDLVPCCTKFELGEELDILWG